MCVVMLHKHLMWTFLIQKDQVPVNVVKI